MKQKSVTVSSKGYIVIPADMRKEMNIKTGTKILLNRESNKIILQPVPSFTKKLSGLSSGSFGHDSKQVEEYIDKARKERCD